MTMRAIDDAKRPSRILEFRNQAERAVDSATGGMDSDLALGPRRFAAPVAAQPGFSFHAQFRDLGARHHDRVPFGPGVLVHAPDEFFEGGVGFAFAGRCEGHAEGNKSSGGGGCRVVWW